jgi:hypothetical protein
MKLRWFRREIYEHREEGPVLVEVLDPVLQYYDEKSGQWEDVNVVSGDIQHGTEAGETGDTALYLTDYTQ